jgi:hypothetical protein
MKIGLNTTTNTRTTFPGQLTAGVHHKRKAVTALQRTADDLLIKHHDQTQLRGYAHFGLHMIVK